MLYTFFKIDDVQVRDTSMNNMLNIELVKRKSPERADELLEVEGSGLRRLGRPAAKCVLSH